MNDMRILERSDIEPVIGHADVLPLMRLVFEEYARGRVKLPDRTALDGWGKNDTVLIMPAAVPAVHGLGTKVISIFPSNASRALPTISSQIILLDGDTGSVRALLDGAFITALRTAAVSALATDILARKDAGSLGVFGAGEQAQHHIEAILQVRELHNVTVFSRSPERAVRLCETCRARQSGDAVFEVAAGPDALIENCDIIVTATTSVEPVFSGSSLRPGTHICAIGSFKPHVRELDDITVSRSKIFVDVTGHALKEAGDLMSPIGRGVIGPERIMGELGQLVTGQCSGRTDDTEITLFKSVGAAMEDIIVAAAICDRLDQQENRSTGRNSQGAVT